MMLLLQTIGALLGVAAVFGFVTLVGGPPPPKEAYGLMCMGGALVGGFAVTWLWARIRYGSGVTVVPSWPEAPKRDPRDMG
jgi:hypothetical protein